LQYGQRKNGNGKLSNKGKKIVNWAMGNNSNLTKTGNIAIFTANQ